jgi:hypothetical protein
MPFLYTSQDTGVKRMRPLDGQRLGSKIQVLLPQDVDVMGPTQSPIPPIPDRTLGALLEDVA